MEAFERAPPTSDAGEAGIKRYFSQVSTCSERVVQMGRWELQVVKNVRGSGPPPFSTASTDSTTGIRGAATGPTAMDEGGILKNDWAKVRIAVLLTAVQEQYRGKEGRCNIGPAAMDGRGMLKNFETKVRIAALLTNV